MMTFETIDHTTNEKPSQWRGDKYKTGRLDGLFVKLSNYDEKTGYFTTTDVAGRKNRVFWHELESKVF